MAKELTAAAAVLLSVAGTNHSREVAKAVFVNLRRGHADEDNKLVKAP